MGGLAVLIASVVTWGVGAAWYGAMARPWQAASGVTAEEARAMPRVIYLLGFACILVVMGFAQWMFYLADVRGTGEGLTTGAMIGGFFVTPWIALNNLYTGRPVMLTLIDGAYAVLGIAAGGAVLGWLG
ncbi:DUF1761 domain-containing protein [Roseobacter sp. HKCCA0434]|uniref:DUF1761 domain-containing protein n=1 Tax=Roseobacter sp. HKCCA0434 TaxID=3079297 RepID=UPI002905DDFB|nr:DUF1761 domain-containing protein [Roseobacter sp. HKCCA0434]